MILANFSDFRTFLEDFGVVVVRSSEIALFVGVKIKCFRNSANLKPHPNIEETDSRKNHC